MDPELEIGQLLSRLVSMLPANTDIRLGGIHGKATGYIAWVQTETKVSNRRYKRFIGSGDDMHAALRDVVQKVEESL